MLEHRANEHGISIVQLRMLGLLRDRIPLMSELGARLGLDKSSISGLVQRAETRGLVERFPSPDDGRAVLVRLTDAGRELAARGEAEFGDDVRNLLAHLPPAERHVLARLVSKLLVSDAAASGVELFPRE
ncbi:MarR family transcriptional regulator [Microbacterium ulmi]|uniref:MarR family transcriptional regulator n=2 Tax=Microbacterium ulmi TaxID=179095 RepID=A0A7Y2PY85_9MICO|nr:MarR family transcriptional regulator [Microbacterium ulmi]NNH03056.1 MarR family transcriptional regulator [Microbacterium ulmi]